MSDENIEEYAEVNTFMRQALAVMHKHNIPPNPLNYAIWYSYVAQEFIGQHPDEYKELEACLEKAGALPKDESLKLLNKYVFLFEEASLKKLQDSLKTLSNQLVTKISDIAEESSVHGDEISKISQELSSVTDESDINLDIVHKITDQAKLMADTGKSFSENMSQAKDEVQVLKKELNKLKLQAVTDGLTGLYNRRAFEEDLGSSIGDEPADVCLAMIDIDHFKSFNDNFGHLIGDRVIKHIAKTLDKHFHEDKNINVYRFGGEEFAVLFSGVPIEKVMEACDEVRDKISKRRLKKRESGERLPVITVSVGVSKYVEKQTVDDFIQQTDSFLYQAKQGGRNRVMTGA